MMFLQAITLIICGFTLWVAGYTGYMTATIGRLYMSTQESIDGIVAQLGKAKDELLTEIADVKAQLEAASVPAETVDLTALTAAAQALDDIVPDA
jgi:hypothetical protein